MAENNFFKRFRKSVKKFVDESIDSAKEAVDREINRILQSAERDVEDSIKICKQILNDFSTEFQDNIRTDIVSSNIFIDETGVSDTIELFGRRVQLPRVEAYIEVTVSNWYDPSKSRGDQKHVDVFGLLNEGRPPVYVPPGKHVPMQLFQYNKDLMTSPDNAEINSTRSFNPDVKWISGGDSGKFIGEVAPREFYESLAIKVNDRLEAEGLFTRFYHLGSGEFGG